MSIYYRRVASHHTSTPAHDLPGSAPPGPRPLFSTMRPMRMPLSEKPTLAPRSHKPLYHYLPPRIVLLLLIFFSLFLFTRLSLHSDEEVVPPRAPLLSRGSILPDSEFNASHPDPSPFEFCPIFGPGDKLGLKYGAPPLLRTRLHLGTNTRIQRVIHKAMSGQPITMSVLGGSVSACHGSGEDPISSKCYPAQFFNWWNSVFPHPASELTNGAMRRTDSSYFSYCSAHHLPDRTDLVILEFDTDDSNDPAWLSHFELLVRSVLIRPDAPAVLVLGHWSPQMQTAHGFVGPEHLHTAVASFYDVPHVSIKGLLYDEYLGNPSGTERSYFIDPVLASPLGHQLITDVLVHYFQTQICIGWEAALGRSYEVPPFVVEANGGAAADSHGLFGGVGVRNGGNNGKAKKDEAGAAAVNRAFTAVPPYMLTTRAGEEMDEFREVEPYCVSANDLINPLPPSLFYGSGWHAHHPVASSTHTDEDKMMYYWHATFPMSKLRVPIKVGSGTVAVWYVLEPRSRAAETAISCWVDNNYGGAVDIVGDGDVDVATPDLVIIDRGVSAGSHYVECQLLGEEGRAVPPFKILGIFTT
ncbi:hypothetical protein BOTBODRAFT_39359 [Botryobasidium botryosum FD-172 SS1]|uniref:Capsular associated protein n=1 Tax=Botryobasidium botryosum (strain FD-172 SS1) TaxID=930990 RepID=A0A067LWS8_BOTB1|nr:hypothetical protein BOTBODRAFT_39359 [Botryobasidium botryosum FD-172 SS1]